MAVALMAAFIGGVVRLAAGEACGQLRLARERGHARMSLYDGASVRTGMAWSSFVCWLVILGARSPGAEVGIAFVCMS